MKAEERHEEHMKRARVDAIDKEHKQAIALLRDAYERMPDLPAGVTHHAQCDHTKCKIRRFLEGGDGDS